jgi:oxygen-independent coproporphyrinogen-3 oxidase
MAGIYISWPFCAQKCTYCNFASGVLPKELEKTYLQALLREIRSHSWLWTPETIYLGGGTPSSMETPAFRELLQALPGQQWREATLEAAPGTLTQERVDCWREAGIDRVSLGVQSFIKTELARTGRKHTAETVEHDVALLRANGINNVNIDLIAGLPGQNEPNWRASVAATLALGVPHVSVYMLEVDDDSSLGSEIILGGKRYGALDIPSDDAIANFYELAVEQLAAAGIERYEISNFARRGSESLHNLKYWRREPYVGFGADAHSFDGQTRWQNVESAPEYAELENARCADSSPDAQEEKFFVGLRMSEGVQPDESDLRRFGSAFERFLSGGLMEKAGERLRLTPRGVMVSNEIFQEFLTV